MQVREVLRVKGPGLFTVDPQQTLAEAMGAMAEHDIGSLAVVKDGRLAGMFTFRELLRALHGQPENAALTVGEVMVSEPVVATPEMELDELRQLMVDHRSRYLPVIDDGALVGVISFHDVAKAVLEEQSFENTLLKNYIRNWPEGEKDEA
ncbi:CBS domain-containing protein [Rhodocyclus tenuis]|uniref:CBS domain-containing protein n=1 Tax=Rhodocyclus tenuis TaxID=1066 RepID=A0A840G8B8_RHOTE|nr:CBS domain-containing protein [Rhodocyclus tenuis]MBB4248106.1 CBS domain-containing protein [Rhodocyclus tenuis]MBK1679404.1 hypothetical protein [Rhodocyclus tenuis]